MEIETVIIGHNYYCTRRYYKQNVIKTGLLLMKHYLLKSIFKGASCYFVYCINEIIYEKVIFRKTLI